LEEAISGCKRSLERNPDHLPGLVSLAAVYGVAHWIDEGRSVVAEILNLDPYFTPDTVIAWPNKYKADVEVVCDDFLKVVIPDE
jgi:hypothetical protein